MASSACPISTRTGLKPVVHRIERWSMKATIRPLETRVAFRVIAGSDSKRITLDLTPCNHPDGCSIASTRNQASPESGFPDSQPGSDRSGSGTPGRRTSLFGQTLHLVGQSLRANGRRNQVGTSSDYSFADDISVIASVDEGPNDAGDGDAAGDNFGGDNAACN